MWTVPLPLFVQVSKNKRFMLNLNVYRNTHHQTLSKAKVNYAAIVKPLLARIPRNLGPVHLTYTLFPRTKAELDTANVLCIVDKFFCDCLVAEKVLSDDNHKIVLTIKFEYGHVDPIDPRAEVTLTLDQPGDFELTQTPSEEDDPMRITIVESEIHDAIKAHILSQISVKEGSEITIDLRATRGAEGFMADIEITSGAPAATETKAAPVAQTRETGVAAAVEAVRSAPAAAPAPTAGTASADVSAAADVTAQAETVTDDSQAQQAEAEAPAEARKSLFAGAAG